MSNLLGHPRLAPIRIILNHDCAAAAHSVYTSISERAEQAPKIVDPFPLRDPGYRPVGEITVNVTSQGLDPNGAPLFVSVAVGRGDWNWIEIGDFLNSLEPSR